MAAGVAGSAHAGSAEKIMLVLTVGFVLGAAQMLLLCRVMGPAASHTRSHHQQQPAVVEKVVEVPAHCSEGSSSSGDLGGRANRHEHPHVVLDDDAGDHQVEEGARSTAPPPVPAIPHGEHVAIALLQRAQFDVLTAEDTEGIVSFARRRASANGTIMLIPVNSGYVDFGLNLMCSLLNLTARRAASGGHRSSSSGAGTTRASGHDGVIEGPTAHRGFVFVAMDKEAHDALTAMRLPVVRDPDMPFISSKSAAWGDPKFHQLVCTKLVIVLRMLRAGLRVILSDADIVILKDFAPFLREDVSVTFSIGSCHRDIADNFRLGDPAIEKLNTGFYFAHPTPGLIAMMARALGTCRSSHMTGDQPAINGAIMDDWGSGKLRAPGRGHGDPTGSPQPSETGLYTYGFFDGCLFANGCVFFKHLCANASYTAKQRRAAQHPGSGPRSGGLPDFTPAMLAAYPRNEAVMVHANFLVGKSKKIQHLKKYGLWDERCIEFAKTRQFKG